MKHKLCLKENQSYSYDDYDDEDDNYDSDYEEENEDEKVCTLTKGHKGECNHLATCTNKKCTDYVTTLHCAYCGKNDGLCNSHLNVHEAKCLIQSKRKPKAKKKAAKRKKVLPPPIYTIPDQFDFERMA